MGNVYRLVVGLSLAVLGCSGGPDRIPSDARVSVSDKFTTEQAEAVLDAVEAWRMATGGTAALRPHIGGDDASELVIKPGYPGSMKLAYTDVSANDRAVMVINVSRHGLGGWDLMTTTEHELGHAFGLTHLDDTLMINGTPKGRLPVDAVTVQRFRANY